MINNDQSTLLCCEDIKSHRSGGDTVPLTLIFKNFIQLDEDNRLDLQS